MTQEVGYNKSTLLEMLRSREVKIKFRKQDGQIRNMRATLRENVIPETNSKKASHTDLITAWDLDAQGWRSFHPDSVLEVL